MEIIIRWEKWLRKKWLWWMFKVNNSDNYC